jgi:geranylgeranyl diphosphate synthase, type I
VTSTGAAWDYAAFREQVQTTLDVFLTEQAARLALLGEEVERLLTAARTSVSGGKRFRAALCYWGFHAVAGPSAAAGDEKALLRACAALELLHASALVHDDYMDASETRRGRPAIHRSFAEEHRSDGWRGDPEQYGASTAILLGVLLLSWSHELLRRCGLPPDRVGTALDVFDQCRSEVITGQFLDLSVQARGVADLDSAMTVLRYKSAKYSVERPLHIGATLACGTDSQLLQLSEFGLPLGEAFQLRDDQLGLYGDPLTTGKPVGDDLIAGKRTVLVALALRAAPAEAAGRLDAALGTDLSSAQVTEMRGIISDSGAPQHVESLIADLAFRATSALSRSDLDEQARSVLSELATVVTARHN